MENPHRKNSGSYCSRFGMIAIKLGYIIRQQLMQALEEQVDDDLNGRPHRVVGAICFDHGWMTPGEIDKVLNAMFNARNKLDDLRLVAS